MGFPYFLSHENDDTTNGMHNLLMKFGNYCRASKNRYLPTTKALSTSRSTCISARENESVREFILDLSGIV